MMESGELKPHRMQTGLTLELVVYKAGGRQGGGKGEHVADGRSVFLVYLCRGMDCCTRSVCVYAPMFCPSPPYYKL